MNNQIISLYQPETDLQTNIEIGAKSDVSVGAIDRTKSKVLQAEIRDSCLVFQLK